MKKKYDPIALPVCLCGHNPVVRNRLAECLPVFSIFYERSFRLPMWVVGCEHCKIATGGNTKREAVQAFRREVQINVVG